MVADTVLVDRLLSKIKNVGTSKLPLHCLAFQKLKNLIPYYNDFGRPHYRFCIVSGAILARQLGYKKNVHSGTRRRRRQWLNLY